MSAFPLSGHVPRNQGCLLCANSRHHPSYSITSSARAISVLGTFIPSVLAVLRLITVSYGWGRPQCFSDKYFFSRNGGSLHPSGRERLPGSVPQ